MTSANSTETDQPFKKLVDAYRGAEKIIKRAETEVELRFGADYAEIKGLFIPSINQLRYAGNHIVSFLENSDKVEECLEKAVSHCVRATCDAYDCVIQFYLRRCQRFLEEYSGVVFGDVIPDFNAKKVALNRIGREPRERGDLSAEYFDGMRRDCELVVAIYDSFDAAREELNKKIAEEYDLAKKYKRDLAIAIFSSLGGGALLTTLVSWLAGLFN